MSASRNGTPITSCERRTGYVLHTRQYTHYILITHKKKYSLHTHYIQESIELLPAHTPHVLVSDLLHVSGSSCKYVCMRAYACSRTRVRACIVRTHTEMHTKYTSMTRPLSRYWRVFALSLDHRADSLAHVICPHACACACACTRVKLLTRVGGHTVLKHDLPPPRPHPPTHLPTPPTHTYTPRELRSSPLVDTDVVTCHSSYAVCVRAPCERARARIRRARGERRLGGKLFPSKSFVL